MTGQHHGHTRVRGNAGKANPLAQSLRSNDVTVAKVLQTAGYKTALIGKWGLGDVGEAEQGLPRRHGYVVLLGAASSVFFYLNSILAWPKLLSAWLFLWQIDRGFLQCQNTKELAAPVRQRRS